MMFAQFAPLNPNAERWRANAQLQSFAWKTKKQPDWTVGLRAGGALIRAAGR
jgi:hypothetical protein